MPIEIHELVIRATIDSGDTRQDAAGQTERQIDRTEQIEECVEQVLDILRKQGER